MLTWLAIVFYQLQARISWQASLQRQADSETDSDSTGNSTLSQFGWRHLSRIGPTVSAEFTLIEVSSAVSIRESTSTMVSAYLSNFQLLFGARLSLQNHHLVHAYCVLHDLTSRIAYKSAHSKPQDIAFRSRQVDFDRSRVEFQHSQSRIVQHQICWPQSARG